jgi:hypothetical protein
MTPSEVLWGCFSHKKRTWRSDPGRLAIALSYFCGLKEHGQKTADRASGIRDKRINEQLCGFGKAGMEGVMKLAASLQDVPLWIKRFHVGVAERLSWQDKQSQMLGMPCHAVSCTPTNDHAWTCDSPCKLGQSFMDFVGTYMVPFVSLVTSTTGGTGRQGQC